MNRILRPRLPKDEDTETFLKDAAQINVKKKRTTIIVTATFCVFILICTVVIIGRRPQIPRETTLCPPGSVNIMDQCFIFLQEKANSSWMEGRRSCQEKGGDLAIIDDCNLMHKLIGYIHANSEEAEKGYWIGASDQQHEGTWKWVDGSNVAMGTPFWGININRPFNPEPAGKKDQNCLQIWGYDAYTFHDGVCAHLKQIICEAPLTEDQCPPLYMNIRGHCFNVPGYEDTWINAFEHCTKVPGGHLAHLKDCRVYGDLIKYMRSNGIAPPRTRFWLGGTDRGKEDVWVWTDGTQVELGAPFWGRDEQGPTEPTGDYQENCAAMMRADRYYFHDEDCDSPTGFVPLCQLK